MSDINYWAVDIPENKPRVEYHYTERRAEILRAVIRNGGPYTMSQYRLAEQYGVNQSTISRDMDAIDDCVEESLGDRAVTAARAAMQHAVQAMDEAAADGDWKAAQAKYELTRDWVELLSDLGAIDTQPDRVEMDVTQREASLQSEDYAIIPDDADIDIDADASDAATFAADMLNGDEPEEQEQEQEADDA